MSKLTASQHRSKEQILTQPEPAKVRETTSAVITKHGSVFLLANDGGDVPWQGVHGYGLYFHDCRYLDGYTLTVNGRRLTALSSVQGRGFEARHYLSNPGLPATDGGIPIAKDALAVRRQRVIRGGTLHEVLSFTNYGCAPARLQIVLRFRASFEDIFVIKGFVAGSVGSVRPPRVVDGQTLELRDEGQDGRLRTTVVAFSPPPAALDTESATYLLDIERGEEVELAVSMTPREHGPSERQRGSARTGERHGTLRYWPERAERMWLARSAEVRSSNPLFDRVFARALLDLRLLRSQVGGLHFFAAGIPWFATLFGRDAATVAIQTLPYGPQIAGETLQLLARYQATDCDPYRDAEPGKILHELRTGELAQSGAIPQSPAYYGTVDATMLFLILLGEYVNWSGDLERARTLRPNVEAALRWMERYADHDGDGYLDYVGEYENGVINQGWKDSGNAIVDAGGRRARTPIALCEVQAYTFRAWRETARVLHALGDAARAQDLEARAEDLRARFERDFWSEVLGCYVLGFQERGRPLAVVASNAGQVLWGGIASAERAGRVVERLLAPDMFSGWGVRTLSEQAVAYNPVSYHLGSVWPHDNGLIVAGFRRYGHDAEALRVFGALFDAAAGCRDYRLPELYCGYPRGADEDRPVRYPVACSPQAWAAGSLPHALWNLLGLRASSLEGRLRIVRPCLPALVEWLELRGVRVGGAAVDLRFEREGEAVEVQWSVRGSEVTVERTEELSPVDAFT